MWLWHTDICKGTESSFVKSNPAWLQQLENSCWKLPPQLLLIKAWPSKPYHSAAVFQQIQSLKEKEKKNKKKQVVVSMPALVNWQVRWGLSVFTWLIVQHEKLSAAFHPRAVQSKGVHHDCCHQYAWSSSVTTMLYYPVGVTLSFTLYLFHLFYSFLFSYLFFLPFMFLSLPIHLFLWHLQDQGEASFQWIQQHSTAFFTVTET